MGGYEMFVNSCDGYYKDSLDVRFTKACDNNCSFCIEKKGLDSLCTKPNVTKMIDNTIKSGKKVVLILGGEPFLYPKELLEYVRGIRDYAREVYITTSVPKTFLTDKDTVFNILDMIDCLNVSVQHYDTEINNDVFQASSRHNRLDVLKFLNESGYENKIRVSINLVKGYIDTKDKLLTCMDILQGLKCKFVKINELQHTPMQYISFEDIMKIDLPSPYAHGCQKLISKEVLNYDMKILLKRACFFVEPSRGATIEDYYKHEEKMNNPPKSELLVLYENGDLSKGWLEKE